MIAFFTLLAGLVLLVLCGDALVRGAVEVARRLGIPPLIIGLTVVAAGTSAPELFVSLEAALLNAPGLAVGNIVGSNITNILLVLGLPAIIAPLLFTESGIRRSAVFMVFISMGLVLMSTDGVLSRVDGLILFGLLLAYLGYNIYAATHARREAQANISADVPDGKPLGIPQIAALLVFGIVGLALGGKLTTEGALDLAAYFGVADSVVGLTIVALGTSLPELAASLAAAYRGQSGVAIGNVVGSNIMNVLGILGITSILVPLNIAPTIASFDLWVMLGTALLMLPIAFVTRKLGRLEGIVMTLAYVTYTVVVFRGGMAF